MPDALAPPRFAYMPFGAGPRVCVGASFALTELVLVTATLVQAETPPSFRLIPRGSG